MIPMIIEWRFSDLILIAGIALLFVGFIMLWLFWHVRKYYKRVSVRAKARRFVRRHNEAAARHITHPGWNGSKLLNEIICDVDDLARNTPFAFRKIVWEEWEKRETPPPPIFPDGSPAYLVTRETRAVTRSARWYARCNKCGRKKKSMFDLTWRLDNYKLDCDHGFIKEGEITLWYKDEAAD